MVDHHRGAGDGEDGAFGDEGRDLAGEGFIGFKPETQLVVTDEGGGEGDAVLDVQDLGLRLMESYRLPPPMGEGAKWVLHGFNCPLDWFGERLSITIPQH